MHALGLTYVWGSAMRLIRIVCKALLLTVHVLDLTQIIVNMFIISIICESELRPSAHAFDYNRISLRGLNALRVRERGIPDRVS